MSNDNVHLRFEKMDAIREDMVGLLAQLRDEMWTKFDAVLDKVIILNRKTKEKLERTEGKLDEVIQCTRLKEQKPIVLNRVKKGGLHKRKP